MASRELKFRSMVLPDVFLDHDKPEKLYAQAGLDAKGIVAKVLATLGRDRDALQKPDRMSGTCVPRETTIASR